MKKIRKNINNYDICIIGGGYVGLDLSIAFSKKYSVICYDINSKRVKMLSRGVDINNQYSKRKILNKNLFFSNKKKIINDLDIYIITVPTPINKFNLPDLNLLKTASKLVGQSIKKKSLIVFESTTFPGCTEEICIPIIERNSKLKFEKDFYVAYSPERVNPGDKINTLHTITKIVGANDQTTLLKVKKLYEVVCKKVYPVSSMKIAESAKAIENVQRDINIALVNEFGMIFNKLNIPTNEVLKAASTKWNFHYYKPGLVGGHCISIDPYYLAFKAKQKNFYPKMILSGRGLNEQMPAYIAQNTVKLMKENNVNIKNASVCILGFSFKENISDIRNTKIISLVRELKKKQITKIKIIEDNEIK